MGNTNLTPEHRAMGPAKVKALSADPALAKKHYEERIAESLARAERYKLKMENALAKAQAKAAREAMQSVTKTNYRSENGRKGGLYGIALMNKRIADLEKNTIRIANELGIAL